MKDLTKEELTPQEKDIILAEFYAEMDQERDEEIHALIVACNQKDQHINMCCLQLRKQDAMLHNWRVLYDEAKAENDMLAKENDELLEQIERMQNEG